MEDLRQFPDAVTPFVKGRFHLNTNNPHPGRAGIVHELWRSRLRDRCEQHGYTVTEEYHLGERKRVDLHATKNGHVILIEVETRNSDVTANIRKTNGQRLIVFFTSERAYAAARTHIPADIMVLKPETINDIHRVLREA